ncbi:unnamed protein product [Zymoseptoria tritici ST99CH_3D7]|uniref:Uncharacterized protein n=1 Tax=Zymoseptoria tritici (strain ST99CH_3D7) TaxID=1276538 RepID=A0A1X7RSS1_ZYMT9|nr:unnamed protein product [Zymoseptoria tritici ST99CH_3D7]
MADPLIQSLRSVSLKISTLPPLAKTAIVGSLAATGAITGAMWKMSDDFKEEKQAIIQSTPAERISQLQFSREKMVKQREELRLKVEGLLGAKGQDGMPVPASPGGPTRASGNR